MTTVHVVRYKRSHFHPRLKLFSEETNLLDWCETNSIPNAMVGGFFLRKQRKPLGEMWIEGQQKQTMPYLKQWSGQRGSLYINEGGDLHIAPRYLFPQNPRTDLLQAGPLLLQNGESVIKTGVDPEGFSEGASQFDEDLTDGRYPRIAIGLNDDYIYGVACDSRIKGENGLALQEFADVLVKIGVTDALNLDGGSSATLISDGKLRNCPRGGYDDNYAAFKRGRPIYSAIVLEEK